MVIVKGHLIKLLSSPDLKITYSVDCVQYHRVPQSGLCSLSTPDYLIWSTVLLLQLEHMEIWTFPSPVLSNSCSLFRL